MNSSKVLKNYSLKMTLPHKKASVVPGFFMSSKSLALRQTSYKLILVSELLYFTDGSMISTFLILNHLQCALGFCSQPLSLEVSKSTIFGLFLLLNCLLPLSPDLHHWCSESCYGVLPYSLCYFLNKLIFSC